MMNEKEFSKLLNQMEYDQDYLRQYCLDQSDGSVWCYHVGLIIDNHLYSKETVLDDERKNYIIFELADMLDGNGFKVRRIKPDYDRVTFYFEPLRK